MTLAEGKEPNQHCIVILSISCISWEEVGQLRYTEVKRLRDKFTIIHPWATFLLWEWDINGNYTVTDHKLIACLNFLGFLNIILFWSYTSLCYLPREVKGILQLLLQIRLLVCSPVVLMLAVIFAILCLVQCLWLCRQQFPWEQPAVAKHKYLYSKCK